MRTMHPTQARPYNTALKGGADLPIRAGLEDVTFAETARGVVFAHDMTSPMPADRLALIAERAECLYSEIPWPAGAAAFYRRSGLEERPHRAYIVALKAMVDRLQKPTFIVGSKRDISLLGGDMFQTNLNGETAWLTALHFGETPAAIHSTALLALLGARYRSVYDFSCGYGRTLTYFAYGIGSDIDTKCLGYIKREILHG